jgi:hypothetical protein
MLWRCELDWTGPGYGCMAGFCNTLKSKDSFLPCRIHILITEYNALSVPALLTPSVDRHLFATWLTARSSEASYSSMNMSLRRLRPLEVKGFDICTALICAFPEHCPLIDNTSQWSCSDWNMSHTYWLQVRRSVCQSKMQKDWTSDYYYWYWNCGRL